LEGDELHPLDFAQRVAGHLGLGSSDTGEEAPAAIEVPGGISDASDTEAAESEVIEDDQGRLRDPETGKFVARPAEAEEDDDDPETVEGEEPETEVDPEAEPEEVDEDDDALVLEIDDPDVASFLAKYDNDPIAALKAATQAQSLIGRQGGELGEVRRELQELKEALASGALTPQAPVDWESEIDNNPAYAAQLAVHHQNVDALTAAIDAWKEVDPFNAGVFLTSLQMEMAQAALEPAQQPAPPADAALDAEVAKVVQKHPDLEKFLPKIGEVAQEQTLLRNALENGATPQERAQALEALYLIARGRDTDTLAKTAATTVKLRTKEAAAPARRDAAVVTTRSQSAAAGAQPTGADAFRQAFRQHMGLPLDLEEE
jgi:hypothetical protein